MYSTATSCLPAWWAMQPSRCHASALIRFHRENLPVDLLGSLQPAGLMVLDGNRQGFGNRCHDVDYDNATYQSQCVSRQRAPSLASHGGGVYSGLEEEIVASALPVAMARLAIRWPRPPRSSGTRFANLLASPDGKAASSDTRGCRCDPAATASRGRRGSRPTPELPGCPPDAAGPCPT